LDCPGFIFFTVVDSTTVVDEDARLEEGGFATNFEIDVDRMVVALLLEGDGVSVGEYFRLSEFDFVERSETGGEELCGNGGIPIAGVGV
jgi:hypothetical protein